VTPPERFPDLAEATERLFDRELSRADREALSAALADEPDALRRFRETTDALMELRKPIDTPDVTAAVLARLDARPGFTSRRSRRLVTTTRLAAAAALLGAGAGVLLLNQYPAPDGAALAREAARSRTLDPLFAEFHSPDLIRADLRTLEPSRYAGRNRAPEPLAAPRSLGTPRLDFEVSALEVWAGAGGPADRAALPQPPRTPVLPDIWASDLMFVPPPLETTPIAAPLAQDRAPWDALFGPRPFDASSLLLPNIDFTLPAAGASGRPQ
jgi:hypothetical protein